MVGNPAATQGRDEKGGAAHAAAGHGLIGEQLGDPQRDQGEKRVGGSTRAQGQVPDGRHAEVGGHLQQQGQEQPNRFRPTDQDREILQFSDMADHHDQPRQEQDTQQPAPQFFLGRLFRGRALQ